MLRSTTTISFTAANHSEVKHIKGGGAIAGVLSQITERTSVSYHLTAVWLKGSYLMGPQADPVFDTMHFFTPFESHRNLSVLVSYCRNGIPQIACYISFFFSPIGFFNAH